MTFPRCAAAAVVAALLGSAALATPGPAPAAAPRPEPFLVIGEGLAAGFGDFSLDATLQTRSFAALVGQRLDEGFALPLIEPPGLGDPPGLPELPVLLPDVGQTWVLHPSDQPADNLAIPGFTVADTIGFRPSPPLVDRTDARRTLAQLILAAARPEELPATSTVLEVAVARRPARVLVALGYQEAIDAALRVLGGGGRLPDPGTFRRQLGQVLATLEASGASLVVATIPDPLDSAYFSSLESAGRLLRIEPALLGRLYGLANGDRLTPPALFEIGSQLITGAIDAQAVRGGVLAAADAAELSRGVAAHNAAIAGLADERGALLFDLHALFRRVREAGIEVGGRRITGDYLGGFFQLNGFYPGATGHAILANQLLDLLALPLGAPLRPYEVTTVARRDPATMAESGAGRLWQPDDLRPDRAPPPPPPPAAPAADTPVVGFFPATTEEGCTPPPGVPACGLPPLAADGGIELPASRQLVLDLNPEMSYYGDSLRVVDCPDDRPLPGFEGLPAFGTCENILFGGLAMTDAAVHGKVRITFDEPTDGRVRFTIDHPGGLRGGDSVVVAPQLYTLPMQGGVLRDVEGLVSSGDLDLATGEVRHLEYFTSVFDTALLALARVNPGLSLGTHAYPGPAGAVIARFTQGADGRLDFSLYATRFLPLGTHVGERPVRFPLPFCDPELLCASIVTRGASLHPNLFLSTATTPPAEGATPPALAENRVEELVTFVPRTRYGDHMDLAVPELGGGATGETHLFGRLRVQTGPRFGHRLPVAITALPPGGSRTPLPELVARLPPGTLAGLAGFGGRLEFPGQAFDIRQVRLAADPWNLALGVVDTRTGRFVGELLHRGLVIHDLIFRILAVEPCNPKGSFCYLGEAAFGAAPGGGSELEFAGATRLPYPAGYRFPAARPGESFVVGEGSQLTPFLALSARSPGDAAGTLRGHDEGLSQYGDRIGIAYSVRCGKAPRLDLTLTDHRRGTTFVTGDLVWLDCSAAGSGTGVDTVTFTATASSGGGAAEHTLSGQLHRTAEATLAALLVDGGTTADLLVLARPVAAGEGAAGAATGEPAVDEVSPPPR